MSITIVSKTQPRIVSLLTDPRVQISLSIIALGAIILFSITGFTYRPYDGAALVSSLEGLTVYALDPGGPGEVGGLKVGDLVLSIDGRPVVAAHKPMYRPGIRSGERVVFDVERDQQVLTLPVTMGGLLDNIVVLANDLLIIPIALICWAIGAAICLFSPPVDVRARLLGLVWLLASVAMAAGGLGSLSHFWGAFTTMETMWCWLAFAFVASHLYFPAPVLIAYQKRIINTVATIACLLSILNIINDWFYKFPRISGVSIHTVIYFFFLLAVLASTGLLVFNRVRSKDPDVRRQIGIIFWGTVLGFAPFVALVMLPSIFGIKVGENASIHVIQDFATVALVLVPLAYVYILFQRRLLHIDFIINRLVASFVLILLILTLSTLILGFISLALDFPTEYLLVGGVLAVGLSLSSSNLEKRVQKRVDLVLYGCHYDFSTVTTSFSNHLARTLDHDKLTSLLVQNLTEQMAIQQATLFLAEGNSLVLQQTPDGQQAASLGGELCRVLMDAQVPVRAPRLWGLLSTTARARWQDYAWVRLFVPLVFEEQFKGLLVLGDRSTGSVYSDQDIRIIATVARQAALAYANVQLVDTLRGLHRQLMQASEDERQRLARDLHDTVLQQLFFVKQGLFRAKVDTTLIELLDDSIQVLRGMIKAQRPPLLNEGLQLALQGLVEDMQTLTGASISWRGDDDARAALSDEQAINLYRIAQEALNNAIKHAQAANITVALEVASGNTQLKIEDDGVGILLPAQGTLSAERHYGLIGMQERASMINAKFHITSSHKEGTIVSAEVNS